MAAGAADFGGEAADELAAQAGRFAGSEVMSEDEHRRNQVSQFLAPPAEQIALEPLFDVENIVRPLREIAIFERLKNLGITAQGAADRVFW